MLSLSSRKRVLTALALAAIGSSAFSTSKAAIIYDINYNGAQIDVTGFIKAASLGTFTGVNFDAQALDYSITVSSNGDSPYTYLPSNSTWGQGGSGSLVQITVTASQIQLSAPVGGNFSFGNTFLTADMATNGVQENLRLFQSSFGARGRFTGAIVFDTVPVPFVLASASAPVPEPASLALWSLGALGVAIVRRRRTNSFA